MTSLDELMNDPIKKLNGLTIIKGVKRPCVRCSGTGYIAIFNHHKNGKCFECNGLGYIKE